MSPFRSKSDAVRTRAALQITLDEALVRIETLRAAIKVETDPATKRRLKTHLRGAQAHYQGWADYVGQACPRVKNATEKPKRKRH